jgi:hypothetical protein
MDYGVILTTVLVLLHQEISDQQCGGITEGREKRSPVENTSAMPDMRS